MVGLYCYELWHLESSQGKITLRVVDNNYLSHGEQIYLSPKTNFLQSYMHSTHCTAVTHLELTLLS